MATNKAWEGNLRTGNAGARKKDKQNISVFVRCRPFSEEEKKTGVAKVVSCNQTDVEVGELDWKHLEMTPFSGNSVSSIARLIYGLYVVK